MCSRSRKKSGLDPTSSNGGALGQVASGSIDVAEDYVRLEVFLHRLLAMLAEGLQPLIRREGSLLLEKK